MAKKGQKLKGKALAAARRNIKKAQAANRRKTGGGSKAKRTYSRRSQGALEGIVASGHDITRPAAELMVPVGIGNVPLTILTGRNFMHPMGGLHSDVQETSIRLAETKDFPQAVANVAMSDNVGYLWGKNVGDISWDKKLQLIRRGIVYNANSAFLGEKGVATTWAPLGIAAGAVVADRVALPFLERVAGRVDGLMEKWS